MRGGGTSGPNGLEHARGLLKADRKGVDGGFGGGLGTACDEAREAEEGEAGGESGEDVGKKDVGFLFGIEEGDDVVDEEGSI